MAAQVSDLTGLVDIIGAINGTSKKETQKTNVSQAGIDELVSRILAGEGGVKSIGSAARRSGLYNSTTEDDLLQELYSNAAVKGELARSPTTTTVQAPGVGLVDTAMTLAASSALSSVLKGEVPFAGVADKLGSMFGGSSGLVANAGSSAVTTGAVPAAANITGKVIAGSGVNSAASAGTSAISTGTNAISKGISSLPAGSIPIGGAFLSGLIGGKDASDDPLNLALASAGGYAALGGLGAIAAPVASLLGGLLSGSGSFSPIKGIKTGLKSIGKVFGF